MRSYTNRMSEDGLPTGSAGSVAPTVSTARVCRTFPISLLFTPLLFGLGAGWISSLNGYGFYPPIVLAGLLAGAAIVALRRHLPAKARTQYFNPTLAAFAISAAAMLVGIEFDLGPRGLAVLGSWCVTTPWTAGDLLLAKLSLLPTAHGLMLIACLLHMLLAPAEQSRGGKAGVRGGVWWRRCQRCVLVLVSLPLVVLLTDALLLGTSEPSELATARSEWLSAAMVLTMAVLMALSAVVIQWLTSARHQG